MYSSIIVRFLVVVVEIDCLLHIIIYVTQIMFFQLIDIINDYFILTQSNVLQEFLM